jgi:hypothetical protein
MEVTQAEKTLLEGLRAEALNADAKRLLESQRPFDLDDIRPGMTPEQIAKATAAIKKAREARER